MKCKFAYGIFCFILSTLSFAMTEEDRAYANQLNREQKHHELYLFSKPFAEQGDNHSQFILGSLHEFGHGVRKDYNQAAIWYEKAAHNGHRIAQLMLAWMYKDGRGVDKNVQKTIFWLEKSAALGESRAYNGLASTYAEGKIVRKDLSKAKEYYGKSCDLGDEWGCKQYAEMYGY